MKVKNIYEIRILPPFAVGRLGSSPVPMHNYKWEFPKAVSGRKVVRTDSLIVDKETGEISLEPAGDKPMEFKDKQGRIHPMSPFLEVWASFKKDGLLEPLTAQHLKDLGLKPEDIYWSVEVGNLKVFRRTHTKDDKVNADTGFFNDHRKHSLLGKSVNFLPGKSLPLGHVQYIKPNKDFPEIRFRFTPAGGYVYGSVKSPSPPKPTDDPNPGIELANVRDTLYSDKSDWVDYQDHDDDPLITAPLSIFAGTNKGRGHFSNGYIDDECDGIVHVKIIVKGMEHTAYARIVAGPPDFAPDHVPVRTVADELEQAMFGPEPGNPVNDPDYKPDAEKIKDILRRALETTHMLNVAYMNANGMPDMDQGQGRALEPILDRAIADTLAIVARHENILLSLEASSLAWFARVLRKYNEVGDLSELGRRKMPALMRGADGNYLALTRRQTGKIEKAANQSIINAHK